MNVQRVNGGQVVSLGGVETEYTANMDIPVAPSRPQTSDRVSPEVQYAAAIGTGAIAGACGAGSILAFVAGTAGAGALLALMCVLGFFLAEHLFSGAKAAEKEEAEDKAKANQALAAVTKPSPRTNTLVGAVGLGSPELALAKPRA